jgi:UDPglucose 6-dehydrogenase
MPTVIAVVGSGYVGTVAAACLAHVGHEVVGIEANPAKLESLRAGRAPFFEPGLDALLQSGLASGRLTFSHDLPAVLHRADLVLVCVGTPGRPDGRPDMTAVEQVARTIGANLRRPCVVVTKSTVPIGTGRWLASVIEESRQEAGLPPADLAVVSNPEFLREGAAVNDFLHPDRVVLGGDDEAALDLVTEMYRPVLNQSFPGGRNIEVAILRTGLATAEMTKYASNAFLATKVSFANEMAHLCELVGADITEVTTGMGLDGRIGGQFLDAGLGWGGSCFGKDVAALIATAHEYDYKPRLLEASVGVNEDQRNLVVTELLRHLKTIRGARVAILGLSFKPGTDDVRDSPAVDVARRLVRREAFVSAFDPMVSHLPDDPQIRIAPDALGAVAGADAVVVATDWPQFLTLDLEQLAQRMRGDLFFDGRNLFDPASVARARLRYAGIGRPGARRRGERRAFERSVGFTPSEQAY